MAGEAVGDRGGGVSGVLSAIFCSSRCFRLSSLGCWGSSFKIFRSSQRILWPERIVFLARSQQPRLESPEQRLEAEDCGKDAAYSTTAIAHGFASHFHQRQKKP